MRSLRLPLLAAALFASTAGAQEPTSHPRVLSPEEIAATGEGFMYGVISIARPDWLQPYTPVYLDGTEIGETEALRTLSTSGVRYARLVSRKSAAPGVRTGQHSLVIQVITTSEPTGMSARRDVRSFSPPSWGRGMELSLTAGYPHLGGRSSLQRYDSRWSAAVALGIPVSNALSVRAMAGVDQLAGTDAITPNTRLKGFELAAKARLSDGLQLHPYLLAGVGFSQLGSGNAATSMIGLDLGGGSDFRVTSRTSVFVEGVMSLLRDSDQRAYNINRIRAGVSLGLGR